LDYNNEMRLFGDSGDSLKLQTMNERLRLPVAILVSLLIHCALLLWIVQLEKIRSPESERLMQVFLLNKDQGFGRQPQFAAGSTMPSINSTQPQSERKPEALPTPPQSVTGVQQNPGLFRFQNPTFNQQAEQMNAMRLAQLAQQREAERAAVMAGMTNLAAQLRPLIRTGIVCVQQTKNEIDCTPAPDDKLRPLLKQFFDLAIQARRLGVAGNPVRMEFGPEQVLSITLQH
jgi:hypothetical protein